MELRSSVKVAAQDFKFFTANFLFKIFLCFFKVVDLEKVEEMIICRMKIRCFKMLLGTVADKTLFHDFSFSEHNLFSLTKKKATGRILCCTSHSVSRT